MTTRSPSSSADTTVVCMRLYALLDAVAGPGLPTSRASVSTPRRASRAPPVAAPGWGSSPQRSPSTTGHTSGGRDRANVRRGKRSNATFAPQERRDHAPERPANRGVVRLEASGSPCEQVDRGRGGEPCRHERFVHPVTGERVDEAASVADEERSPAREPRVGAPERQAVATNVPESVGTRAMRPAEPLEVRAQRGPLPLPPADAEVEMITLREHPAVAARDRPELEDRRAGMALPRHRIREVALERDPVRGLRPDRETLRGDSVGPVGADQQAGAHAIGAERDGDPAGIDVEPGDTNAVAEIRPRCRGALGEQRVEPPALRHQDQRPFAAPLVRVSVRVAKAHAGDDVLDHRIGREWQLGDRTHRQAAAARLVAGEAGPVDEQDGRARAGEPVGGDGAGGPGPGYDCVESLHGPDRNGAGQGPAPPMTQSLRGARSRPRGPRRSRSSRGSRGGASLARSISASGDTIAPSSCLPTSFSAIRPRALSTSRTTTSTMSPRVRTSSM